MATRAVSGKPSDQAAEVHDLQLVGSRPCKVSWLRGPGIPGRSLGQKKSGGDGRLLCLKCHGARIGFGGPIRCQLSMAPWLMADLAFLRYHTNATWRREVARSFAEARRRDGEDGAKHVHAVSQKRAGSLINSRDEADNNLGFEICDDFGDTSRKSVACTYSGHVRIRSKGRSTRYSYPTRRTSYHTTSTCARRSIHHDHHQYATHPNCQCRAVTNICQRCRALRLI